jgi:two-component system, NtrC family, nitrogen regulation response regulator GlnG
MPSLLIVDDEPSVCYSFRRVFGGEGYEVRTAPTAAAGLDAVRAAPPDVVVLDLQLPDRNGLDLFRELHALDPKRPVIIITAHGTADTALAAMKDGAFDYLIKPLDLDRLSQVIARAVEAAQVAAPPSAGDDDPDRILGRSPVVQEMSKVMGRLAPQDVPVLILGESGVGKELVARSLHRHSRRAAGPFLAINCGALPEYLVESELFGYEMGAFTGAVRRKPGRFEQADGGTLFLDEIGDMTPATQAKVLRVLQEQRFERVGSNETIQVDVRILAATNQDLEALTAAGRFRKDLYYRLKVATVTVPPLRERREDVPELARHFLARFNRELGRDIADIAPQTMDLFVRHDWPGNVRQLQHVLKVAMLHAVGRVLLPEALPPDVRGDRPAPPAGRGEELPDVAAVLDELLRRGERDLYDKVISLVERVLFTRLLRHTHGHQAQASELLGISRSTLRAKLRALGIALDRVPVEDEREEPR